MVHRYQAVTLLSLCMQKHEKDDITFFTFDHLSKAGIKHFISTRTGGKSQNPRKTLNLGLHVNDDPKTVISNRKKLAKALGMNLENFVLAKQTHSDHIVIAGQEHKGRGATCWENAIDDCDALITDTTEIVVAINVADCVPILLADPVSQCVAAIHAGWKGTFQKIVQKTLLEMIENHQCNPKSMLAGIGPGICEKCYEVDLNLYTRFESEFSTYQRIGHQEEKRSFLDLAHINALQLEHSGIPTHNIEISPYCTSCNNDLFFSHRKEKGSGRFWAAVWTT